MISSVYSVWCVEGDVYRRVAKFPSGIREVVLLVHLKKHGVLFRLETGATLLPSKKLLDHAPNLRSLFNPNTPNFNKNTVLVLPEKCGEI